MADINREAEEFTRIMAQVNYEMRAYGELSASTAARRNDAEMKAKFGLDDFSKSTGMGADALSKVGAAALSSGKALLAAKNGTADFSGAMDQMTDAVKMAAVALTLLVPGGPLIKGLMAGIGLLTVSVLEAGKEYMKATNAMREQLAKGYQDLALSGAAASDGMTGLKEDAKKLGLSMNDIGQYTELIAANSKDLALFSGTVFEGRQKFADMGQAMEPFKESLLNSGLTQEQINAGAMGYLKLQTRIGMSQTQTSAQLADGAKKYLIEMDGLSKITGETRKGMEDQMEAARSEERFAAKLQELRSQGRHDEAKQLELANLMISKENKALAQGFRDASTGMITTEAAQKAMLVTQGQVMVQADRMSTGLATAGEGATIIGQTAGNTAKSMTGLAKAGAYFGADFAADLRSGLTDYNKALIEATKEQAKQGATGGKAADDAVQAQTDLRRAQIAGNKATEQFVFAGIVPATKAMEVLAKTTTAGVESLNKLFGITPSKETPGAPRGPDLTKATAELDASTEKAKLANERAAAAEKDANLTRAEKDRIKKEARDSEAAVMQDVFKQREAQLREQNARREARKAGKVAPASAAPASAAPASAAPASAAPASAAPVSISPAGSKPAAPSALRSVASAAAPSAGGGASPVPAGGDVAGAKPPADKEVTAKPVGDVQMGADVRIGNEIRKGGTVSWRTNNPGNVSYGGLSKKYGAIGTWKKLDGDAQQRSTGIAILPNIEAGNQLKMGLWRRPMYIDKTIDQGVAQWTGTTGLGSTYAKDLAKAAGATLETSIRDLSDSQLLAMTEKQKVWEGFKAGTVVSAADGGMFSGPKSGYSATLHGSEAVIPLKNGAVPVSLSMTDVLGGLGDDIAEQLKEIKNQSTSENDSVMRQVTSEFKTAMAQLSQQLSENARMQNQDGMSSVAALLQELISATKSGVDVQQKILASSY